MSTIPDMPIDMGIALLDLATRTDDPEELARITERIRVLLDEPPKDYDYNDLDINGLDILRFAVALRESKRILTGTTEGALLQCLKGYYLLMILNRDHHDDPTQAQIEEVHARAQEAFPQWKLRVNLMYLKREMESARRS